MQNKRWSGFFTNLLGVILGIMLTFGANSLWQKHEDRKRTREMLILVRNELEINKEWFKDQESYMKKDCYAYKKLLEANKNWWSIPKDTLSAYRSRLESRTFSQLSSSAWQIFQNSEIIQKMADKELVIRLTTCYNTTDIIKEIIEKYYWDKKEKAANVFELDLYDYLNAVMNNKESVYFFDDMSNSTSIWDIFFVMDAIIDYTIMLLEKDGYYQYDMEKTDEDFILFFESRMDSILHKNSRIENSQD